MVPLFGAGASSGFLHFIAIALDIACAFETVVYMIAFRLNSDWDYQGSAIIKTTLSDEFLLLGLSSALAFIHIGLLTLENKGGRHFLLD